MGSQFDWINKQYGLAVAKGSRCTYTGNKQAGAQRGTVVAASGQYLRIRLDGEKHVGSYHPTWEMAYDGKAGA